MHTFLYQNAYILIACLSVVTYSVIRPRRASKIDEFNSTDCYNKYPDGSLDNTFPTYHHQPPVDECIGIDPSTVSVRIKTGTGESVAVGWYTRGTCDEYAARWDITFDKNIDGGSDCHAVVRDPSHPDTTRVHDVYFLDQVG